MAVTRWVMILLACMSAACWADVQGKVTAVDAGSGTVKIAVQGGAVQARDVFVIVRDGQPLGECMVVSSQGSEATLMTKAGFKGAARKGDAAQFVRHAAAPPSDTGLSRAEQEALFKRLAQAVNAGAVQRTKLQGMGDVPFEDMARTGGLLVGFEVSYDKFFNNFRIKSVQPIYQALNGRESGAVHAGPVGVDTHQIVARPGYAVGAITVKSGLTVDGFSVTFMKINKDGLDARDSYTSEWQGGPGGGSKATLGGDGSFVVGVYGKLSKDKDPKKLVVCSMGLVTVPGR